MNQAATIMAKDVKFLTTQISDEAVTSFTTMSSASKREGEQPIALTNWLFSQ